MALIVCEECNKEISDKAVSCIHCGAPIALEGIANNALTIQETSKDLKLDIIIAWGMFILGVIFASVEAPAIGAMLIILGISFWVITKFRIWWNHS